MRKFAMAMEFIGGFEPTHVSFCEIETLLDEDAVPNGVVVAIEYSVDVRIHALKMLSRHQRPTLAGLHKESPFCFGPLHTILFANLQFAA